VEEAVRGDRESHGNRETNTISNNDPIKITSLSFNFDFFQTRKIEYFSPN